MIATVDEQLEALIDAAVHYLSECSVIEKQPKGMDMAGRRLRYVLDRIETMQSGEEEIFQPTAEEYRYFKAQAGSAKELCKQFLIGIKTIPRLERDSSVL